MIQFHVRPFNPAKRIRGTVNNKDFPLSMLFEPQWWPAWRPLMPAVPRRCAYHQSYLSVREVFDSLRQDLAQTDGTEKMARSEPTVHGFRPPALSENDSYAHRRVDTVILEMISWVEQFMVTIVFGTSLLSTVLLRGMKKASWRLYPEGFTGICEKATYGRWGQSHNVRWWHQGYLPNEALWTTYIPGPLLETNMPRVTQSSRVSQQIL